MQSKIKHTIWGYFQFFYEIVGNKLLFNIFLGLSVSVMDGIGLTMFIPLLQFVSGSGRSSVNEKSMGALHYIIDIFKVVYLPINIYTVLFMMVIVFSIKAALNYWSQISQVHLRQMFIRKVRYELTDSLEKLDYVSFLELDAGKIQNTLTAEVGKLYNAIIAYLGTLRGVAMMLTYVAFAFMANWQFAVLVAVGAYLSNFLFKKIFATVKEFSINVSKKGHIFNDYLIQSVHYFKYLKATNLISDFSKKLKNLIDETEKANGKIGASQAFTSSLREPMVVLIVAIVVAIQVRWMGSSVGSIILSILLFYRSLSFLLGIQTGWQGFIQNVGGIDSVSGLNYFMRLKKEVQPDNVLPAISTGLRTADLVFAYGENVVLNKVNIDIPKNKAIALVGESGSGKTTLANIITGLLQPQSGDLLIDDISLKQYNLETYRNRIGYISQEAVVFNDNIFNNVTFWAEPTPENVERFWLSIEKASLTEFVNNLPNKENTPLGNSGTLISGGQKQRISIARELYKDVDIFIMDEATSALDSETERLIQESIEKLRGSYTVVIIAHRLSTIKNVDIIYLLDKGDVIAKGTFREMIEISPKFKNMVSLQEMH